MGECDHAHIVLASKALDEPPCGDLVTTVWGVRNALGEEENIHGIGIVPTSAAPASLEFGKQAPPPKVPTPAKFSYGAGEFWEGLLGGFVADEGVPAAAS